MHCYHRPLIRHRPVGFFFQPQAFISCSLSTKSTTILVTSGCLHPATHGSRRNASLQARALSSADVRHARHPHPFNNQTQSALAVPRPIRPPKQQSHTTFTGSSVACHAVRSAKRLKYERSQQLPEPVVLAVLPDGSDVWRLDPIVELLKNGGVGIIPTDTLPAFVCDITNPAAVRRMCGIKDINPKKPLSILCRNLSSISVYTQGIPASTLPGQPDLYRHVRKVLPGPYTFILLASKNLPRMCIDTLRGTTKHRTSVGVRWPNNPICQAILDGFGGPLLCTSVHMDAQHSIDDTTEVPDTGTLLELYGQRGIDFLLDVPPYVATASTVIDLTGPIPELVRLGKGDAELFVGE